MLFHCAQRLPDAALAPLAALGGGGNRNRSAMFFGTHQSVDRGSSRQGSDHSGSSSSSGIHISRLSPSDLMET